jgi:hypothetical protein
MSRVGSQLLKGHFDRDNETINYEGFQISLHYIPTAHFCNGNNCSMCRSDLPPFRKHSGIMPFLINKEDVS